MTYSEKLKDPRWQKRRLEILKRDNFSCYYCADSETELHIHHEYYDFKLQPWEYEAESTKTVCKYCHLILEDLKTDNTIIKVIKITKLENNIDDYYIHFLVKADTDNGISAIMYSYHVPIQAMKHTINIQQITCRKILEFLQSE